VDLVNKTLRQAPIRQGDGLFCSAVPSYIRCHRPAWPGNPVFHDARDAIDRARRTGYLRGY